MEEKCSCCGLKVGEKVMMTGFVPSLLWMETRRYENGFIYQTFGYGDDPNDRLMYRPNYCPECGKKIEKCLERKE